MAILSTQKEALNTNRNIKFLHRKNDQLHSEHIKLRPGFRANGSALLPLALRAGLDFSTKLNIYSLFNRFPKFLNSTIIVLAACFFFQTSYTNNVSATSITLTIPSDPLSLDISDASSNGGFHKSSASTFSVKTDASAGYTLSIKSKNNDSDINKSNDLINGSNNSSKISSILSPVSEEDFSSTGLANTWGYQPSKLNSRDNTNFISGPTSELTTIDETSSANNNTPTNYNITLGAKIDSNTPSGNYSNTFILTAVANKPKDMQNVDCDSLSDYETSKQIAELTDSRDGNTYKIAKLKDGKCWMVENLRLGDSKLQNRTITSDNSDVSSDFTLPASTTSGFTNGQYDTAWVYVDPTYGGYYSWRAATADTGRASLSNGNATSSICPKGWRLPTGGPGGEFEVMAKKYGSGTDQATSDALQVTPVPGFTLSGGYYNSSLVGQGSYGYFWSSTANSNAAYSLNPGSSGVNPTYTSNKYNGPSVRCVARENIDYSITFNDNSGSNGPGVQNGTTKDSSIKLSSIQPTRSGYEFKGWCDKETSDETCSGTTYQPGSDYDILDGRNTTTLYAMWQRSSSCPNAITDCSYNGYSGKRFGNGPCYMSSNYQSNVVWLSAYCPSGWSLPSQSQFNALTSSSQAGNGDCLYEQGWSGSYWSSIKYSLPGAHYALSVWSNGAGIGGNDDSLSLNVRCVSS